MKSNLWWLIIAGIQICAAQTKVDLRTQGQSPDLSAMGPTKPFQTGSPLPSSCTIGQAFFLTTAPTGANLYGCTSNGTWSQLNGGLANGVRISTATADTLQPGDNGKNVVYTSSTAVAVTLPQPGAATINGTWRVFTFNGGGGNVTITPASSTLNGASSLLLPPMQGISLWSDGLNYYSSGVVLQPGSGIQIINSQLSADSSVMLSIADYQAGRPLACFSSSNSSTAYTCTSGVVFSAYANGMHLYWQPDTACTGTPTLAVNGLPPVPIRKAGGTALDSGDCGTALKNLTLAYNAVAAGAPFWEIVGGGATGSASTTNAPTTAVLTDQSNVFTTGTQDFSRAQHVLPLPTGLTAAMPASCSVGEEYFATDTTAGLNVYHCTAANTWTQSPQLTSQSGGSSVSFSGPYMKVGSDSYLPFGYLATLPATTGWSPENFTGSSFVTSGLGGAVSLTSGSFSQTPGSLAAQSRDRGTTTTLTAVLSSEQLLSSGWSGCGIGVLNSTTAAAYNINNVFYSATNVTEEDSFMNGLGSGAIFQGSQGLGGSQLVFLQLQVTNSGIDSFVSMNGLQWTRLASRSFGGYGIASSYDKWLFAGGGSTSNPTTCTLLSWNVR